MAEEKKTTDRRVLRTKRAIRNAFAKLLTEKDINDITIRDIADLADINRKTFYNYYAGVYQVVDEIENDIITTLETVLGEVDFKRDMRAPFVFFEKVTSIINLDLDFYGQMLAMNRNVSLVTKIAALMKEKTKKAMMAQLALPEETADVVLEYTFSGMVAVYQKWFHSHRSASIEEISELIRVLCFQGVNGVIDPAEGETGRLSQ